MPAITHHSTLTKETPKEAFYPIEKIVVNVGVGRLRGQPSFDDKVLPALIDEVAAITGQRPATRAAKRSIAGFKMREGEVVGLQVTLRRERMRRFMSKLVHLVLPRVKDFRGLEPTNVDENGNLNIGFREQFVFPEVSAEKSKVTFGLQVTVVPRERDRVRALELYRTLGVPLRTK